MNEIKRKVKYEGELDLAGFKLPCFVLEDGTRVLSERGMQGVLKIEDNDKQKRGAQLTRFLAQKSLQPFIYQEKKAANFNPIPCQKGEMKINGYEATLLPEMCSIFLKVRKEA
jgi:hypothetical protein